LQRNFLWGGDREHKKILWVKWEDICLPKAEGGLGIKEISKFNEALLGKWIWALASDQQQLWARIINSKYGGWKEFQFGRDKRGFSYWWRDLRKLYHQADHSIFHQNMAWKIGCGDRINFWTDRWVREEFTLEQKYNQLFMISRQQHSLISMMGTFSQDNWRWGLKWRRNLFDHENDLAVNFMEDITSIYIQRYVKDTMMWKADSSGVYSTKSAYRLMLKPNVPGSEVRISKLIWKLKIPPRAAVFTWRLLKDRLSTKGNLLRRNV
ncbi:Putative ribonuclease H protein, partial [Glycine soja]